jgi:hypothetical protein
MDEDHPMLYPPEVQIIYKSGDEFMNGWYGLGLVQNPVSVVQQALAH